MARLIRAVVMFHTNDDDKDHDTHVTVIVRQSDGTVAALISDDFGRFPDHSDNGPFDLTTYDAQKDQLTGGQVQIRIDPVGDDTWRFNFFIDLLFDDASHLTATGSGLDMDQDRNQQTYGLS